jgi:uncharacterized protein YceH (UPF0502 family)
LVEKGLTTPDQYPLTLKGCTTGCNQKNNRDPVTTYDEDKVSDFLEKLREKGLVAEVFTDGARVAKYRHYMRKRTPLTEAQLAIFCELLLRGRQQPGELRTRAGRMCEIPTQEQLRTELNGLMDLGYIRANGPLDRRGVEVDHTWYEPREGQTMPAAVLEAAPVAPVPTHVPSAVSHSTPVAVRPDPLAARVEELSRQVAEVVASRKRVEEELDEVREQVRRLVEEVAGLRQALGG